MRRVLLGVLWALGLSACAGRAECGFPVPAGIIGTSSKCEATIRVAAVHFGPEEGNVARNRSRLVQLTQEAAEHGAKVVVHTEMATSGYSFFSRDEIGAVAETIPGPSTRAIGEVARRYGIYVVFGLPELDPTTGLFYNSAALVGPTGVIGVYRKRNNLLESAYTAEVRSPIETFETPYGRLGVVICADFFYAAFPRLAALAGADLLLVPANTGVSADFVRARSWENDMPVVLANRYGKGTRGKRSEYFDQNSFSIPLPFPYDFSYDSRSLITSRSGDVLSEVTEQADKIAYAEVPVHGVRVLPVVRRPELYSLIAQDTLEPYTFSQLGLPAPAKFAVAGVDPGASQKPWESVVIAIRHALAVASERGYDLRLAVLPGDYFADKSASGMKALQDLAVERHVDVLVSVRGGEGAPSSVLVASNGQQYEYVRTHRLRSEAIKDSALASRLWVVDRDYARVALLHDVDLLAPETSLVMEKLGVDVVAMASDSSEPLRGAIWRIRTGDYYNIVQSNLNGVEGVYAGGYPKDPVVEGEGLALMQIDTSLVRRKMSSRFLEAGELLRGAR